MKERISVGVGETAPVSIRASFGVKLEARQSKKGIGQG